MVRLLLLTVVLGLLFYGAQGLWRKLAPSLAGQWHRLALGAAVVALLVLAATGRLGLLLAALGAAAAYVARNLPIALRWAPVLQRLWRQARAFVRTGGSMETAWLRLTVDVASGAWGGAVLAGRYAGRQLQDLSLDQLLALHRDLQSADAPSAELLEAYLDQLHGNEWRRVAASGQGGAETRPRGGKMSREEAREVLGVAAGASREEVVAAHRRLMQKFHPDRGGSDFLAAKINQAKDVLLGNKTA